MTILYVRNLPLFWNQKHYDKRIMAISDNDVMTTIYHVIFDLPIFTGFGAVWMEIENLAENDIVYCFEFSSLSSY